MNDLTTTNELDYNRQLIAEHEREWVPCGAPDASRIGELIVAAYPRAKVHSPEEYAKLVVSTIAKYPKVVALEAMERLTESSKYLPTRADVKDALEEVAIERRAAVARARELLKHIEEREAWLERAERRKQEREAFEREHGEAWRSWLKLPLMGRPPFEEFEQDFNAKLIETGRITEEQARKW